MNYFLILLLSVTTAGLPQDIPSTSSGDLKFYVDYASFKGSEGKTHQEFYLMIHADQFGFDGINNISYGVEYTIKDLNKDLISENEGESDALITSDSINLKNLVFYDGWNILLDPGR